MKKFLLSLTLMPLIMSAQTDGPPTPPAPSENIDFPPGPGLPIDNLDLLLLSIFLISIFVFLYFRRLNINN